jgi:hypothetical protein
MPKYTYDIMANHQWVLYVGWSRYTGIIIKIIIEHTKVNIKNIKPQISSLYNIKDSQMLIQMQEKQYTATARKL